MATDSQAAIGRTKNLETERHKGWIEERAAAGGGEMLTWVKGRSGKRNRGPKSKKEAWMGARRGDKNIATAGGIRQEFRLTWRTKQVHEWDSDALKGHNYICTDRGPFKAWLHKVGRVDSPKCPIGEAMQTAAHILQCKWVSGGEKRLAEFNFLWEKAG